MKNDSVDLELLKTIQDDVNLNYVVRSKIYPQHPNALYLTLRGGGVSVYDVSNPSNPQLKTHWDENNVAVEGQDCVDNLLVVIAINTGMLYTFDVSNPFKLVKLGSLEMDIGIPIIQKFKALHTKIYTQNGKKYAIVTSPLTTQFVAVDVTEPKNPQQIYSLLTGVLGLEGVYLKDHYAFCGGYWDEEFVVIDLSNLPSGMQIKKTLKEDYYRQMVSIIGPSNPNVLYASCWADRGGLAVFDVSDPENTHELVFRQVNVDE
jgi:hypothetical protein